MTILLTHFLNTPEVAGITAAVIVALFNFGLAFVSQLKKELNYESI